MGIFFRYFLIQRIRKIQSNMRKRPGIRSKTLPKLGVENFFFEIFRNWPRFFDLKDVKLNSESNGTGQKFQKTRDFAQESIKCQNFLKRRLRKITRLFWIFEDYSHTQNLILHLLSPKLKGVRPFGPHAIGFQMGTNSVG